MVTEMLVGQDFTGLKQFSTNLGYPDNDGFKWEEFKKKRKGSTRYKCIECDAEKIKYKTQTQLKQTRFTMQNNPITVKYNMSHSCNSQPAIKNILTRTFHNRTKSTKKTVNDIGTNTLGETLIDSENSETYSIDLNDGDDSNAQKDAIIQSFSPPCKAEMDSREVESVALAQDYSYTHEEDIDLASLLEDDWDVTDTGVTHSEDADFDDEICNVDDILSESIPLESQQCDNNAMTFDTENSEENTDHQINDNEISDKEKGSNNDAPKLIEKGKSAEAGMKKTNSRNEVCIEDEETKDETNEIKIVTVSTLDEIVEQVNQSTAYMIPNTSTKPKINRKMYQWGPNQPGRKGLSYYKCAGTSGAKAPCKASKYMFHCNGICNRKVWDNLCCKTAQEKLVILYLEPHTCEIKNQFCEVNNLDDMFANLQVLNENEKNKYEVIQAKKLPFDITGNKLYLIEMEEGDANIENFIKDGRRYDKSFNSKNSAFNKVFGKRMENKVRLYKCRGTNYCFNTECPFLRRFEAINQVQFDIKDGEKHCVSCGEAMHSLNCDAKKYVAHDEKYIVVKHEGHHECPPRSTYETDIVNEIENYFSINGLSTPFEAVVNHLNKKMNLENAEKEIKDLVSFSLKKWTMKNAKRRVIKRQNPYGPTLQV